MRPGGVRLVRTPLFLRLGEWRTTVQAYLPWQPRPDSGCPAAPGDDKDGDAYTAVPLSAQGEVALTLQIKEAFGLPAEDGTTVVGVRQGHHAPLTPLCMVPRLPAECLSQELEVVLAPTRQRPEMAPLPALELDPALAVGCAARLRGAGGVLPADRAFAELLCSGLSVRGMLRTVLTPAQLATVSRATAAFDQFCRTW
eukprot:COSAG06_NODE_9685_length_1845_cov_1.018900_2_plen_198_part_00